MKMTQTIEWFDVRYNTSWVTEW